MHHNQNNTPDNKNLILAVAFSLIILGLFHFFYEKPRMEQLERERALATSTIPEVEQTAPKTIQSSAKKSSAPSPRAIIDTPRVSGSVALRGARIDNLSLKDYFVTLKKEENVQVLSPSDQDISYYGEFGWVPANVSTAVPGKNTTWRVRGNNKLTPETPLVLAWSNGQGQQFEQKIEIDNDYLFTVTQSVTNTSGQNVTLHPYGLISRQGLPQDMQSLFILHEGPIGYLDGELEEPDYDDLKDDGSISYKDKGGWIGITDKYWLTALLPDTDTEHTMRFLHTAPDGADRYQTDFLGEGMMIANGETKSVSTRFFAGAKELALLDRYEDSLDIAHLDLAIDFGWFYFITKPFFYALGFIYSLVGNYGIAIILFTVLLRLALFPLANKSFKSMAKMKQLTPKLQEMKEKYGDDRMKLQQSIMELYQKEQVNPLSGCMPMFLQIPVFFALYKVLYVTIEIRHQPFFGWIQDLSLPDPTTVFNLFGLIPWNPPSILMIGAWPLIMGLTLFLQQKLNPKPQDPMQAKMMMFFPAFMTFLLARFPAGLVVYWSFSNLFSIAQQWFIMRRMGVKVELIEKDNDK